MTPRLRPDELAAAAGLPPAIVERVIALGALRPDGDGTLGASDAAIATTVADLLDAGIEDRHLRWLVEERGMRFDVVAELFPEAAPLPGHAAPRQPGVGAGPGGDPALDRLAAALGLPAPDADGHRPDADVAMLRALHAAWAGVDPSGQAARRVGRAARDAAAHLVETWLDAWDAAAQPNIFTAGAPAEGEGHHGSNPTPRMAELARQLVVLLLDRAVHEALTARIIAGVERELSAAGRLPARPRRPEAIAFVDLSGFTSHAVEAGDQAAVEAAERLREVVERCVGRGGGRVVKRLGDGAMLLFPDPASAVTTTLAIVGDEGLDPGLPVHGAVAAGRVVRHEGDVFGVTVNLAARLLGSAGPGEVLVEEGVVVALPRGTASFRPVGRLPLRGFPAPVAVWQALPPG